MSILSTLMSSQLRTIATIGITTAIGTGIGLAIHFTQQVTSLNDENMANIMNLVNKTITPTKEKNETKQ